jgi:hypothetical protein
LDTGPKEEELNKVQEAISLLAELVSSDINLDQQAIENILNDINFNRRDWAKSLLEQASEILKKAHEDLNSNNRNSIIEELKLLGIKEFPAIMAYEEAKPKPLCVEPEQVKFDNVKPGEEINTTLKVTGGVVKEITASSRLKLNLIRSSDGSNLIKITVIGTKAGESFTDYVFIRSDKGDLRVPVTISVQQTPMNECCECAKHSNDLIPVSRLYDIRLKISLPAYRQYICRQCWEQKTDTPTFIKEPPLLSWCPDCGEKIKKKSLFYNHYEKRYECFYCKHMFQYPDKRVAKYNENRH